MKTLFLISLTLSFLTPWPTTSFIHSHAETTPIPNDAGIQIGDKGPQFNLKNIDGKMYSFGNIKDANGNHPKGYIIVFTCNTCPFSQANEQRLINIHNTYAPKGYPVVAIQPNNPAFKSGDSFEAMKQNAKEKAFPFLYLLDEGQKVYPQYRATRTPEVFLLDADLILRYHGAIDDSPRNSSGVSEKFVEKAIDAIAAGDDPETKITKSIGCGIK